MAGIANVGFVAKPLSASGAAQVGPGVMAGIFVGTSTALTIKVWDSLSASGTVIVDTTVALTAGTYLTIPATFLIGCYITVGGVGTFTVFVA